MVCIYKELCVQVYPTYNSYAAAPARLHAEMACIVEDGTAQAKVAWADTTAVLNLLKLEPAYATYPDL